MNPTPTYYGATFVDSIAVKLLCRNAILAGVGNELHLHTNAGTVILPKPLQLRRKVHGIEVLRSTDNAYKLLIYGEKEFMLLKCSKTFKFLYDGLLNDWISCGKFLEGAQEFILLTAHSVLLRFYYSEEPTPQCQMISRISCTDKCTLYCSYLHGSDWEQLLVFGGMFSIAFLPIITLLIVGNAFGELLIWQPGANGGTDAKVPLLQRVPTHNGVLFSIDYNVNAKLLITTSDDRSIKFWRVTQAEGKHKWLDTQLTLQASGFGHVARVFKGKFITFAKKVYAITVGEDSHFCIWQHCGELMFKRRHQFGATIWNFEYDEETTTLFTVGSTGNLLAYDISDVLQNSMSTVHTLPPLQPEEFVSKIKFLAANLLIGVTNRNRLLRKRLAKGSTDEAWESVSAAAALGAYKCTVLEVHDNLIALCGYMRFTLLKYDNTNDDFVLLHDGQLLGGVIRAFQFLSAGSYLLSDDLGQCALLRGEQAQLLCHIELPKCREPWLTSALLLPHEFLLASNRQGNLMLYAWQQRSCGFELRCMLKQLHGNLGVTTLQLVEHTDEKVLIKSAGHDGALKLLCLQKAEAMLQIYASEHVPVTWVEQLIEVRKAPLLLLLLGFNDNHLVVWSRSHDFVRQVPCGGGHRCWHYVIIEDEAHTCWLQLVFIQHKRVLLHRMKLFNAVKTSIQLPPPNEWHVRPCNVMSVLERAAATVLVTAGDDNLIKVSSYRMLNGNDRLLQQAEVRGHISNVRALKVVRLNADSCLVVSGGGRAQLCISKLHLGTFEVQQLLNYTLRSCKTQQPSLTYSVDPETRIMSIDVQPLQPYEAEEFHIYLGCSDGFVRKLHLNAHTQLTAMEELWYGKCVLQVRLIGDAYLLTAATDGILNFYDVNLQPAAPLLQLNHHASGVNALDALLEPQHENAVGPMTLHLMSGGDDQTLTYTQLLLAPPEVPKVVRTVHLPHQHTAQVTAVQLFAGADDLLSFSSGVDQQLCILNLRTLQTERMFHSCVADIKGLCVDRRKTCFLYGCGLQIHRFDSSRRSNTYQPTVPELHFK